MRSVAVFSSGAFNVTESKDYFVNPGCFGDDLARWIMGRLAEQGIETDEEPDQEDFGWYFNFKTADGEHCCVLSFRPGEGVEGGDWILWIERRTGLIGSLLGRRNRVSPVAVELLHQVLFGAEEVSGLQWHEKELFDRGDESQGRSGPVDWGR